MYELTSDNTLPGLIVKRDSNEAPSQFFRRHLNRHAETSRGAVIRVGLASIPSHYLDKDVCRDPAQAHLIAITDVLPEGKLRVVDSSRIPCIRRVSGSGIDRRQKNAINNSGTHSCDGLSNIVLTGTPLRSLEDSRLFESRILPDFELKRRLSQEKLLELLDS